MRYLKYFGYGDEVYADGQDPYAEGEGGSEATYWNDNSGQYYDENGARWVQKGGRAGEDSGQAGKVSLTDLFQKYIPELERDIALKQNERMRREAKSMRSFHTNGLRDIDTESYWNAKKDTTDYDPGFANRIKASGVSKETLQGSGYDGGEKYACGGRAASKQYGGDFKVVEHSDEELKRIIRQADALQRKAYDNGEYDGMRWSYMDPKFVWREKLYKLIKDYPELYERYDSDYGTSWDMTLEDYDAMMADRGVDTTGRAAMRKKYFGTPYLDSLSKAPLKEPMEKMQAGGESSNFWDKLGEKVGRIPGKVSKVVERLTPEKKSFMEEYFGPEEVRKLEYDDIHNPEQRFDRHDEWYWATNDLRREISRRKREDFENRAYDYSWIDEPANLNNHSRGRMNQIANGMAMTNYLNANNLIDKTVYTRPGIEKEIKDKWKNKWAALSGNDVPYYIDSIKTGYTGYEY